MSATPPRSRQPQRWATPGSAHDRLVRWIKIGLPMAAGVLIAVLALAPLDRSGDVSFILDKNKVDSAPERMRVENARYSGTDADGRTFELTAKKAIQPTSNVPIVDIAGILAELNLPNGVVQIKADDGRYELETHVLSVPGGVAVTGPDNYRLDTSNVTVDLKAKTLDGEGPVSGRTSLGPFSAGHLSANLGERSVVLDRGARLKIEQGVVR